MSDQHQSTPWRWQDHFDLWLRTRPDMRVRSLMEQLEEYVLLHPELAKKANDDVH